MVEKLETHLWASTGYSPHDWLTHLRIEEAKTRLQRKPHSLIDIALDCGFSSHGHFSNTFRRIVGVTPREYRTRLWSDSVNVVSFRE